MEENSFPIEALYEKAKAYTDTTLELAKLKALDKTADLVSTLIPRLLVAVLLILFVFCANIALALWLGLLTGQAWYGFLLVAGFYLLIAAILHFFLHLPLKKRIANAFISSLFS